MSNVVTHDFLPKHRAPEGWLEHLLAMIANRRRYAGIRNELASLSDRELEDIGLTRDRIHEVARSGARGV